MASMTVKSADNFVQKKFEKMTFFPFFVRNTPSEGYYYTSGVMIEDCRLTDTGSTPEAEPSGA